MTRISAKFSESDLNGISIPFPTALLTTAADLARALDAEVRTVGRV
jgi:hypothetical protein